MIPWVCISTRIPYNLAHEEVRVQRTLDELTTGQVNTYGQNGTADDPR